MFPGMTDQSRSLWFPCAPGSFRLADNLEVVPETVANRF